MWVTISSFKVAIIVSMHRIQIRVCKIFIHVIHLLELCRGVAVTKTFGDIHLLYLFAKQLKHSASDQSIFLFCSLALTFVHYEHNNKIHSSKMKYAQAYGCTRHDQHMNIWWAIYLISLYGYKVVSVPVCTEDGHNWLMHRIQIRVCKVFTRVIHYAPISHIIIGFMWKMLPW